MTKATEARWAERIRQWRESNLPAEEFAEGKDFKASSLLWAASMIHSETASSRARARATTTGPREAAKQRRLSPSETPRFLPVRARSSALPDGELIVEVGAARIRVTRGVDVSLLGDVVRALEGVGR